MVAVKRSRTPTVVLTANEEVHTHEEAQVFVHDLNRNVLQNSKKKEHKMKPCNKKDAPEEKHGNWR